MTNNERIEAYFNNDLSEIEKQNLLTEIDSNPVLKEEFEFQQDVTDGIKAYRKNELIARLDNVQIVSTGQALLVKTIAVIGIVGVGSLGTYLWLDSKDAPDKEITVNTEEALNSSSDKSTIAEASDTETISIDGIKGDEEINKATDNKSSIKNTRDTELPDVTIPEVKEPEIDSAVETDEDINTPGAVSESAISLTTRTDVEIVISKKYSFHYLVKDGKLTLYGDFKDSPFEIIELNTNNRIKTYLFYKDNFFELRQDRERIRPLEAVENDNLIKELQKRR
ncbi:MAG: hypothetical protein ABFS32_20925 [Bacteroidota bacterium]